MAVSFGTSGVSTVSGSVTTFSATFNIGTLTNGALVGVLMGSSGTAPTITAFTWNGVSMTPALVSNANASSASVALFGLANPASGSHSMSVTISSAAEQMALGFWSFNGADQTGGTTTFYNATSSIGTGSQSTRTVGQSTNNGDATVAAWALGLSQSGTETPAADWHIDTPFITRGQHQLSTGSSDSYVESISSTDQMDFYGVSIKALASSGPPVGQYSDRPAPVNWYQSWTEWKQQTPTVKTTFGGNYPWPNPPPVTWYQNWTFAAEPLIVPRVLTNFRQNDWPLPGTPQRLNDYTWIEQGNSLLPLQNLTKPTNQQDWPDPYPVIWYRSWEKWTQQTPTVKTTFQQTDWPNPQPIFWYRDWAQNPLPLRGFVQAPFKQTDWPNPTIINWYQHWEQWAQPTPTVKTTFQQNDWPNSQAVSWYRDWFQNLLESTLAPTTRLPFNQSDWPVPRINQPIDQFYFQNLLEGPLGLVLMPFTNVWALVEPTTLQPIDPTWINNPSIYYPSPTNPFIQTDWPLPYPVKWYEDWYQALALLLPINTNRILNQADWPVPRSPQPIDQTWIQALVGLFPPAPPVVPPTTTGRSYTESELKDYWTKRFVEHTKQQHLVVPPSISAHMAKLGKLSGIARRK